MSKKVHTFQVPSSFFMYDTRKMSTGTSAVVSNVIARATIAVSVEDTSDWAWS